jgi:hypothetical protein
VSEDAGCPLSRLTLSVYCTGRSCERQRAERTNPCCTEMGGVVSLKVV